MSKTQSHMCKDDEHGRRLADVDPDGTHTIECAFCGHTIHDPDVVFLDVEFRPIPVEAANSVTVVAGGTVFTGMPA